MENDWAYRIIELLIYDLDFGIGFYGHKVTVDKCPHLPETLEFKPQSLQELKL
jgi:hypothetical protein